MEREDLFDVDVEPVICEYISGSEALPNVKYVEGVTYDALLTDYFKVKKAYIDAKETIEEQKMLLQSAMEISFCDKLRKEREESEESQKHTISKPPLGVKPCYIQAEERIKDLADGISRYAHKGDYEIIKRWANEILMQCDIAEMEELK